MDGLRLLRAENVQSARVVGHTRGQTNRAPHGGRERERELLSLALNSKIKRRGSRRLRGGGGMHACTDL